MQYRHEIEHAPAMLAPVGEGTGKVKDVRSDAVWACNRGTLSLASPRSGTNFKLRFTRFQ